MPTIDSIILMHRVFTGSTRLTGDAISECECVLVFCHAFLLKFYSLLCSSTHCCIQRGAEFSDATNVQFTEDSRDLLLQHEPCETGVVPHVGGVGKPF